MDGRGLNGIRWRFALASALLTIVGILVREAVPGHDIESTLVNLSTLGLLVLAIASITFLMASNLTGSIDHCSAAPRPSQRATSTAPSTCHNWPACHWTS
jgi:hypothetical protein